MLEIPPEIKKKCEDIEGHLSTKEGMLLYSFAHNADNRGHIIEIGSYKGKSTTWMGFGSMNGNKAKIIAVDPGIGSDEVGNYPTKEAFIKNIKDAGVEEIIRPIFKTSEDAAREWEGQVSFLFIDAAHDYQNVKKDFELWEPHLLANSFLAMHDCLNPSDGPARVFLEEVLLSGRFSDFGKADSILFARKKESSYNYKTFILKELLRFHIFIARNYKKLPHRLGYLEKILIRKLVKHFADYKI